MTCPGCGCPDLVETILADGMHYGRLDCPVCERWVKWLPRPRLAWTELTLPPGLRAGDELPELVGTDKQITYADSLRRPMLRGIWVLGEEYHALSLAMATITDASWWIANREASLEKMVWPAAWLPKRGDS